MKIHSATGRLADFISENKPKELVLTGSELRQVLLAAGYEIEEVDVMSEPQGLLHRRQVTGKVEAIKRHDNHYRLDDLTLTIRYGSEFVDDEGNLVFIPHGDLSAPTQSGGMVTFGDARLAEIATHTVVRIPLPEPIIELPVPNWVWGTVDDWFSSYEAVGTHIMFKSEAREAVQAFIVVLAEVELL